VIIFKHAKNKKVKLFERRLFPLEEIQQ